MKFLALVLVVIIAFVVVDIVDPVYGFFGKVPTASVGVVTRFGKIEKETLEPGFHVKGWFDRINNISTKTQKYSVETAAFSSDIQQVNVKLTLNYNVDKINAPALFETVGKSYESMLIQPRLVENVKVVFARYNAEKLLENRGVLSEEICSLMKEDLIEFGINASGVAIEDIDFSDAFTNAVEAKQVATQEALTAKTEQEKLTMQANAEAQRKKVEAEAKAEIAKMEADANAYAVQVQAEAEAEANTKIAASLSDKLIEYRYTEAWNGILPNTFIGNSDALPIINIDTSEAN